MYKARETKTIKFVAAKSSDKSCLSVLTNAVSIRHELKHKNIVEFFCWYETRNHIWTVAEFCCGGTVAELQKLDGRLPEQTIVTFCSDIVQALLYVHRQGILVCDMKPSNFLIDEFGTIKLNNFKYSRYIPQSTDEINETKRGSPSYMAPELFLKNATYSYSSDLWSLGCMLYEFFCGDPPFVSQSLKELIEKVCTAEYEAHDDMSADFAELISGCARVHMHFRKAKIMILGITEWI